MTEIIHLGTRGNKPELVKGRIGSSSQGSVQASGPANIDLLTPPRRLYPLPVPRT